MMNKSAEAVAAQNEIDILVERLADNEIFELAKDWFANSHYGIAFIKEYLRGAVEVTVERLEYRYASNLETTGDIVRFDATMDCHVAAVHLADESAAPARAVQRVTFRCVIAFDGTVEIFHGFMAYPGDAQRDDTIISPADKNFVPMIRKDDLDAEAAAFLDAYYPQALVTPQPVPIGEILVGRIGLFIMNDTRVANKANAETAAESPAFGQILFSDTPVEFTCPPVVRIT